MMDFVQFEEVNNLPKWLNDIGGYNEINRCIKIVTKKLYNNYNKFYTAEEIESYLWEISLSKIDKMKSSAYMVTTMKMAIYRLLRVYKEDRYIKTISLDAELSNDEDSLNIKDKIAVEETESYDAGDIICDIRTIKDKTLKYFILSTGYLISDLEFLEDDFKQMLSKCKPKISAKLIKLYVKKLDGAQLKISDILRAFSLVHFVKDDYPMIPTDEIKPKTYLQEVKDYIKFTGIFGVNSTE